MAKLITDKGKKAIIKMAEISQIARVLSLAPTPEEFALRLISDMRRIAAMINNISIRIDEIMDRYSSIPVEFLLSGFDEILEKLNNINDYAKFAIAETSDLMSNTIYGVQELTTAVGDIASTVSSAVVQIGGGLTYGYISTNENFNLALNRGREKNAMDKGIFDDNYEVFQDVIDGKIKVSDMENALSGLSDNQSYINWMNDSSNNIKDGTLEWAEGSTNWLDGVVENVNESLDDATNWIDDKKDDANEIVDNNVGVLIEKVENAKKTVADKIEQVRISFDDLIKKFDDFMGFAIPINHNYRKTIVDKLSDTAYAMDTPVYDALGDLTSEISNFISNFSIGKAITGIASIYVCAGAATLAMELLPSIDVERMLKEIVGGVKIYQNDKMSELYYNKYYENGPDLLEIPPYAIDTNEENKEYYDKINNIKELEKSKKGLEEKYKENGEKYENFLNNSNENNTSVIVGIMGYLKHTDEYNKTKSDLENELNEINEQLIEEKSALKDLRKQRRNAIKGRLQERYKMLLKIELDNLTNECNNIKNNIKFEWDSMTQQYKDAIEAIKKFFSNENCGGFEYIDRCCERINNDAEQIVELCKEIPLIFSNVSMNIIIPYSIGTCVDMPVHKILEFFRDLKIVMIYVRNIIRLGIDIISQLTILAKIVANGFQSLAEIMKTIRNIIGVDKIFNLIDYLVAVFRPTMLDAKMMLENFISPIYYKDHPEYTEIETALEELDGEDSGYIDEFRYTDDPYARKRYKKDKYIYGGNMNDEDEITEAIEQLEQKGEREIVAYRSPILNAAGDDFAGWIFYNAIAYDKMNKGWSDGRKRRTNKLIKKASKKNKFRLGRLVGGVASLKNNMDFGNYTDGKYNKNTVSGFDAYYWYTKWTNDPTDCDPDFSNREEIYDEDGNLIGYETIDENVVEPILTTANGSMVELSDGRRVFVQGEHVKSGDFVVVDGMKYKVK